MKRWVLATTVGIQLVLASSMVPAQAFTARNLIVGSRGYDVDELQNRLVFLGYFHHKITGNFGWDTYWAVRDFQYAFGMKPTGRVDMGTKLKLVKATKNWHYQGSSNGSTSGSASAASTNSSTSNSGGSNSGASNSGASNSGASNSGASNSGSSTNSSSGSTTAAANYVSTVPTNGISASDQNLLAHVVYAEARGEPFIGQVAVAAVILNRLNDPKFPHSIPGIVYQPEAFTSVQDGQINLQPDAESFKAVHDAIRGWDPSDGATYYFNPATATSSWIWSKPEILKIGNHIFCRS